MASLAWTHLAAFNLSHVAKALYADHAHHIGGVHLPAKEVVHQLLGKLHVTGTQCADQLEVEGGGEGIGRRYVQMEGEHKVDTRICDCSKFQPRRFISCIKNCLKQLTKDYEAEVSCNQL